MKGGQKEAAAVVFGMAAPKPERGKPVPRAIEGVLFAHAPVGANTPGTLETALDIARTLQEHSGDGVLEGWPPEDEYIHLWHILLLVRQTSPGHATGTMDYTAKPCCPLAQRNMMMDFIAALRRTGIKVDRNAAWPEVP